VIDGDLFLSSWRRDLTIGKGVARRNKRAAQACAWRPGAKNCVFVRSRLLRTNVLPLALDTEDSFWG
jgi:hypothetical protein